MDLLNDPRALATNPTVQLILEAMKGRLRYVSTEKKATTIRKSVKQGAELPSVEDFLKGLVAVDERLGSEEEYLSETELREIFGKEQGGMLALQILHVFGEEAPASGPKTKPTSSNHVSPPSAIETLRLEQSKLREDLAQVSDILCRL